MVTKRQIEKITVNLLFSLFIQFSGIGMNQMSLLSRKAYDKLISMTGKKSGAHRAHARW